MELRIKTIWIVIAAVVLLAGVFMLGQIPQRKVIKAQKEQITMLQNDIACYDSVMTGQQKQLSIDSVLIVETKKRNDFLQIRNAAKDKQIIALRYSVSQLSDSIAFILTNDIDCPPCNPDLPSLILPFIFQAETDMVSIDGYFDEDGELTLKVKTTTAVDTTILIP